MQVNIYEAKTRLSALVDQVRQGVTDVIAKNGTPLAKLVALDATPKRQINFGLMKGKCVEPGDFDARLPDDLLAVFEGGDTTRAPTDSKPLDCCWTPSLRSG